MRRWTTAKLVAERLGIRMMTVSIADQIDAYFAGFPDAPRPPTRQQDGAAKRMTILYDKSAAQEALVIGTSNKTELLIGYGTIHGDMASALNPIGDLYKTQVRALSAHMGVPPAIIDKNPTADLWVGQTDEAELGFTYAEVDRLLARMVDERARPDELIADGFDHAFVARIAPDDPDEPLQNAGSRSSPSSRTARSSSTSAMHATGGPDS